MTVTHRRGLETAVVAALAITLLGNGCAHDAGVTTLPAAVQRGPHAAKQQARRPMFVSLEWEQPGRDGAQRMRVVGAGATVLEDRGAQRSVRPGADDYERLADAATRATVLAALRDPACATAGDAPATPRLKLVVDGEPPADVDPARCAAAVPSFAPLQRAVEQIWARYAPAPGPAPRAS